MYHDLTYLHAAGDSNVTLVANVDALVFFDDGLFCFYGGDRAGVLEEPMVKDKKEGLLCLHTIGSNNALDSSFLAFSPLLTLALYGKGKTPLLALYFVRWQGASVTVTIS